MISKRQLARGRMPDGQPNPLDVHIGNRLRLMIRSRRKPLAECFLRLIDEISRTPGHEGEVSLRACLGTKLAGLK